MMNRLRPTSCLLRTFSVFKKNNDNHVDATLKTIGFELSLNPGRYYDFDGMKKLLKIDLDIKTILMNPQEFTEYNNKLESRKLQFCIAATLKTAYYEGMIDKLHKECVETIQNGSLPQENTELNTTPKAR